MIYFCAQRNRRAAVLANPALNGIDYLEVAADQKTLVVTFLRATGLAALTPVQFAITGGETVTDVRILSIAPGDLPTQRRLTASKIGDFSPYTLLVRATPDTTDPPDGFDPILSTVEFSFAAGCPSTVDCAVTECCPTPETSGPPINYLAKDYPGFVQVMLDRMAVLTPTWTERHAADFGVTLVETLAYVADHLSYRQDAVATEAYLGTARSRISLRRHARLVDYMVGEGSNARAWVHMRVEVDGATVPAGSLVLPRVAGAPTRIDPASGLAAQMIAGSAVIFATMADATLHTEQNDIDFYTWGDTSCCLPVGATAATLTKTLQTLQVGDGLTFEEVLGPKTGVAGDANPTHRCTVRLTAVRTTDHLGRLLADPLTQQNITQIEWGPADALPFSLCVSSIGANSQALPPVSKARGNMVPADHGFWHMAEPLGTVSPAPPMPVGTAAGSCCDGPAPTPPRPFYYPSLQFGPVTFARPYDASQPASGFARAPEVNDAAPVPQIQTQDESTAPWTTEPDLLALEESQRGFVLEVERDGTAFLRFGDGVNGAAPEPGQTFTATYRTGNGTLGNVGAEMLGHIVPTTLRDAQNHAVPTGIGVVAVRNPLGAAGGVDPDTMERIRQVAPWNFRTQLRAVTEDDYGMVAARDPAIREARGTLRWTGSWRTASVTIEPLVGATPGPALAAATQTRLDLMRMAGVDLDVEPAVIVGLRIALNICVADGYFRTEVRRALMELFTAGMRCDGQPGLLSPQRFTFGQTIYLSPLIAAAQVVDGVASVHVTAFQRVDDPLRDATQDGFIALHRLEIARVDNDPSRPDHGIFTLALDGGQ